MAVPFEFSDERPTQLTLGDGQGRVVATAAAEVRVRAQAAGGVGAPAGPHESCCLMLQDVFVTNACTTVQRQMMRCDALRRELGTRVLTFDLCASSLLCACTAHQYLRQPLQHLVVCLLSVSSTFRLLSTTPRRNAARTAALSLVAVSRRDAARTAALFLVAVSLAVSVSVCLCVRGLLVPVAPQFARPYIVRAALSLSYRPA